MDGNNLRKTSYATEHSIGSLIVLGCGTITILPDSPFTREI